MLRVRAAASGPVRARSVRMFGRLTHGFNSSRTYNHLISRSLLVPATTCWRSALFPWQAPSRLPLLAPHSLPASTPPTSFSHSLATAARPSACRVAGQPAMSDVSLFQPRDRRHRRLPSDVGSDDTYAPVSGSGLSQWDPKGRQHRLHVSSDSNDMVTSGLTQRPTSDTPLAQWEPESPFLQGMRNRELRRQAELRAASVLSAAVLSAAVAQASAPTSAPLPPSPPPPPSPLHPTSGAAKRRRGSNQGDSTANQSKRQRPAPIVHEEQSDDDIHSSAATQQLSQRPPLEEEEDGSRSALQHCGEMEMAEERKTDKAADGDGDSDCRVIRYVQTKSEPGQTEEKTAQRTLSITSDSDLDPDLDRIPCQWFLWMHHIAHRFPPNEQQQAFLLQDDRMRCSSTRLGLVTYGDLCKRHAKGLLGVYVAHSREPGAGMGLFTVWPRAKKEVICEYRGTIRPQHDEKGAAGAHSGKYAVDVPVLDGEPSGLVIDASRSTDHFARYANDRSLGVKEAEKTLCNCWFLPGEAHPRPVHHARVFLQASKDIAAGDELSAAYGNAYWTPAMRRSPLAVTHCLSRRVCMYLLVNSNSISPTCECCMHRIIREAQGEPARRRERARQREQKDSDSGSD